MNKQYICIGLVGLAAPLLCLAGSQPKVDAKFGKVPLSFEPNRGQSDPRVDYLSRGKGYTLLLTHGQAVLRLGGGSPIRMELAGASSHAVASALDQLPGRVNYFGGKDPSKWHTGIPTYQKVKYSGLYPGVDLVYYGNQGRLEHDFIVAPGADPSQIVLRIEGAQSKINDHGDLCLMVDGSELQFQKPVVYQAGVNGKRHVDGRYALEGETVRFKLGAYDHSRELVIDPLLVYAGYLGGNSYDYGTGIAVDGMGSAYVTGWTSSSNFPTMGPIDTSIGSAASIAFVSKFDATGTQLVYSTYLGGASSTDQVVYNQDVAVDSQGNAYVAGTTVDDDFPVTPGAFQTICAPSMVNGNIVQGCNPATNGYVTKINPEGNALVYSTFLGGGGGDTIINALAVNSAGEAYVTGYTGDQCSGANEYPVDCFPTTAGALQPGTQLGAGYGSPFAFVTKFDAAGASLMYSTLYGSKTINQGSCTQACDQDTTEGNAIAVDGNGDAYITGWTTDENIPITSGAYQTSASPIQGNNDPSNYYLLLGQRGFVAKFDPTQSGSASLVYATFLAGTGGSQGTDADFGTGIAVDSSGNAYVTGQAGSPNFPTTKGAFQRTCYSSNGRTGQCIGAFITKLNSTGAAPVYSTFLGDATSVNSSVTAVRIRVNASGSAFVTGSSGAGFPLQNPIQTSPQNAYVTEMNPAGSALLFSSFFGGTCCIWPASLAVDSLGSIYLTGYTGGDLLVTPNAFQQTFGGGQTDAFVEKIATVASDAQVNNSAATSVATGTDLTYTITAANAGPDPATKVVVTDTVPTGASYVSVTASTGSCKPNAGNTKVTCNIGNLAVNATVTISLTVKVDAAAGKEIGDTAHISAAGFDPNTANNSSTIKTKVTR
jgi:uncharacterized repeat protein (TIGR01451 family)